LDGETKTQHTTSGGGGKCGLRDPTPDRAPLAQKPEVKQRHQRSGQETQITWRQNVHEEIQTARRKTAHGGRAMLGCALRFSWSRTPSCDQKENRIELTMLWPSSFTETSRHGHKKSKTKTGSCKTRSSTEKMNSSYETKQNCKSQQILTTTEVTALPPSSD
jgi:hypothetical protein